MYRSNNKKILFLSTIQGHASISDAASIFLTKHGYQTSTFSYTDPLQLFYQPAYKLFPNLVKLPFLIINQKKLSHFFKYYLSKKYKRVLNKAIEKKPDLIISSYFAFDPAIEKTKLKTPYINIITDPKTYVRLSLSVAANTNCVFDKNQEEACKNNNPKAQTLITGWFVRDEYEKSYQKNDLRKKLKIPSNKLTFLIVSGSGGTTHIMKILPTLLKIKKEVKVVIACGNNKSLFKSATTFKKMAKKTKSMASITPIKFTKSLHEYMQAADLVIGKAGPNTLFESAATLTPFFAITHISGQEDGNLDIIKEYNLGYVEENPIKASKIISSIIDNPQQLNNFQDSLKKMKKYNQGSKTKLLKLVEKLLEKN